MRYIIDMLETRKVRCTYIVEVEAPNEELARFKAEMGDTVQADTGFEYILVHREVLSVEPC